jgi:hypothetical protein
VVVVVGKVVVMPVLLVAVAIDVGAEVVAAVAILVNVLAVGIHVVRVRQRLAKLPIWIGSRHCASMANGATLARRERERVREPWSAIL